MDQQGSDRAGGRIRSECRPPARGVRRVRHIRPPGCRRHHRARPARAPAPRPGSRRHRLLRRQALPFRAPPRPGRRHLRQARGDRPPARHHRRRPCALFDHRRNHLAQRAAAVRRARRRRLRHRPQRQFDQRHRAAPRAGARRRHDAVDHRHRGDPASGGARAPQPFRRPLHRGPAPARGRLCLRRADQQEAGRRARPVRHPPAGDRQARRLPDPGVGNLRPRHHRRQIRARRRERRSGDLRRGRLPVAQAVPADGGAPLHLRIHLFRAARIRSSAAATSTTCARPWARSSRARRPPPPT